MSRHGKDFNKRYFEIFKKVEEVNLKIVMKPLKNS